MRRVTREGAHDEIAPWYIECAWDDIVRLVPLLLDLREERLGRTWYKGTPTPGRMALSCPSGFSSRYDHSYQRKQQGDDVWSCPPSSHIPPCKAILRAIVPEAGCFLKT